MVTQLCFRFFLWLYCFLFLHQFLKQKSLFIGEKKKLCQAEIKYIFKDKKGSEKKKHTHLPNFTLPVRQISSWYFVIIYIYTGRSGEGCFPGSAGGKEPACQCRRCQKRAFDPWVGKIPWRRAWLPIPVLLTGESRGPRSLAGHGPWGCRVRHH